MSNVTIPNEPLQEWANANKPDDKMLWKEAFWDQIIFVRDRVAGILARTYDEYRNLVCVIGTHTSKSIKCPVYRIHLDLKPPAGGVDITMRYNFYNWNISIESSERINANFLGIVIDEDYGYCYCEGMEKWKYGKMADSKFKFTVCVTTHYEAFVFFWVLRNYFGIKKGD